MIHSPDIQYVVINVVSAIVAVKLTRMVYHAYKRTGDDTLKLLAFGLACFVGGTLAAAAGGILMGIHNSVVIAESTLTLIGLGIVVYSAVRR